MIKVIHTLLKSDEAKKEVKELVIEDVGLDQQKDIEDLRFEIEKDIAEDQVLEKEEEEEEEEKEDDDEEKDTEDDVYKDSLLHHKVTSWVDPVSGKTYHGIRVMDVIPSTDCKRYNFNLCPICSRPYTLNKIHQMSCLPCGHIVGMSCLKYWMEGRSSDNCPECCQNFSLECVRLLYATRLGIPASANKKASIRRFSFSKIGFTTFKQYEWELRTNALNNRSVVLKQRADVLGRQKDAMKRRAELLNRMANIEKRVDVLEQQNGAMKRKLLNRMTDEEEWAEASEQQADAEKRAEVLRRKAGALGKSADEYLRKADAFGQHAKSLRQQAKSLGQLVDSYLASRKFYIQSCKEFLGLHDNKITE